VNLTVNEDMRVEDLRALVALRESPGWPILCRILSDRVLALADVQGTDQPEETVGRIKEIGHLVSLPKEAQEILLTRTGNKEQHDADE